jgi:hypothetical protein
VRPRPPPRRFGSPATIAAPLAAACALAASPLRAADPAPVSPTVPTVPLSATSQCVEGPGAPPSDPTKVTRIVPGQPAPASAPPPPEEPSLDDPPTPGAPPRVLLEPAVFAGFSVRFDDPPFLETTRRAGLVLGGSLFVSPSRLLAFGATYQHTDLHHSDSPRGTTNVIAIDYDTHTLFAEARVVPIRFSSIALFASIGAGPAWQNASLRATIVGVNGMPGASVRCSAGSDADFAFRGALGMKARISRAASMLLDASFVGYRLSADILGSCAPGAGTAQTVMFRAGVTYDIDISKIVR